MPIGVILTGDRKIVERFEQFPEFARQALLAHITAITDRLALAVRAKVPQRTGKLASLVQSGVENKPNKIRGWVSLAGAPKNDVLRAQALEYGSHKLIAVAAYKRGSDRVAAKFAEPGSNVVRAYNRTTNIAQQRFIRGPIQDMQSEIAAELQQAVATAATTAP